MIVRLNETHRVATDPRNYILQERHYPEKGKLAGQETWKDVSYHRTLKQAVQSFTERELRLSDARTTNQIIDKIAELRRNIEELQEPPRKAHG